MVGIELLVFELKNLGITIFAKPRNPGIVCDLTLSSNAFDILPK